MRVGVMSDTHGLTAGTNRALQAMGEIDALIHTGDFHADALRLASMLKVPVHAVAGNCDAPLRGPEELLLTLEGHKIFITHGHLFRVKHNLHNLFYKAQEISAKVVVFGHTHIPLNLLNSGILFFNPGSPAYPRPGHAAGCGVLEITRREVKGELLSL
ncbi:MAG: metallophosphoesterase [Firmicutes bacterium]|nr:metallophosphoesterase [Bacillota bacterium]